MSGSLCAELMTGYDKSQGNQIRLVDRPRFWGGGNYYRFLVAAIILYCLNYLWKRARKIKNIDCLRLGW